MSGMACSTNAPWSFTSEAACAGFSPRASMPETPIDIWRSVA